MFEGSSERVTEAKVRGFAAALRHLPDTAGMSTAGPGNAAEAAADGAELVEQLRALEELKSAAAAAQARVTARFAAGQRAAQRARGVPASECGRGVGAQVALARRDSPARGSRHLGLAEALVHDMPHTLAALEAGHISEWRATLVVRETACLSAEHRRQVDAELAARPGGLAAMGDRTIADEARRIGYRLDPHAVTDRATRAAADRRVGLRPAPDTMCVLSGLLPAPQGVAAYAALSKHADACRAQGDQRTRGQIMADTLVERVTGQARADAVPVEVNVVMTERSLLGGSHEPAELAGYGPLPAPATRRWLRGEPGGADDQPTGADHEPGGVQVGGLPPAARAWLRRLYTAPETGELVAMESTRRCFDGGLRRLVILRDRRCRTPWCDAPIRHVDHPVSVTQAGKTSAANSQGLCEACNYTKEVPGWSTRVREDGAVETTTPTGHGYITHPPPVPGRTPSDSGRPPPGRETAPVDPPAPQAAA